MGKFCIIEVDLGVICACMPSLPALFRPLVHRLTGKHKASAARRAGYIGDLPRRATTSDDTKSSPTISAMSSASYPVLQPDPHDTAYDPHDGHQAEKVRATNTTISQTSWRNDSLELPRPDRDIELGAVSHGYVSSQGWDAGLMHGSYGSSHQSHQ